MDPTTTNDGELMTCRKCGQPIGDPALHEASCPVRTVRLGDDGEPLSHAVDLPEDRDWLTVNDVHGAIGSALFDPEQRRQDDFAGHVLKLFEVPPGLAGVETICSTCYDQDEVVIHNVNGRCDRCGGTDWMEVEGDDD